MEWHCEIQYLIILFRVRRNKKKKRRIENKSERWFSKINGWKEIRKVKRDKEWLCIFWIVEIAFRRPLKNRKIKVIWYDIENKVRSLDKSWVVTSIVKS